MQSLTDLLKNFVGKQQQRSSAPHSPTAATARREDVEMADIVDAELEMLLSQYDHGQHNMQPCASSSRPISDEIDLLDPSLEMVLSQYDRLPNLSGNG